MKSEAEKCHESRDQRTSNDDLNLCGDEEPFWSFGFRSSGMKVGVTKQVKFKVLPFIVKIQGLTLINCAR